VEEKASQNFRRKEHRSGFIISNLLPVPQLCPRRGLHQSIEEREKVGGHFERERETTFT
jgi:hypothetical protein